MKKWIFLIFVICILIAEAKTERLDLRAGESYFDDGRNITLVKFDTKQEKAIFCVNNKNVILSEGKSNLFKDVTFELKRVDKDSVIVDIRITCDNCICDENCKNDKCIVKMEEDECIEDNDCDDNNILTIDKCKDKKCFYYEKEVLREEEIASNEKKDNSTIYAFLFIFFVIIISIFTWVKVGIKQ